MKRFNELNYALCSLLAALLNSRLKTTDEPAATADYRYRSADLIGGKFIVFSFNSNVVW